MYNINKMQLTALVCAALFQNFVAQYHKVYHDAAEYNYRQHIFCDNAEYIQTSNAANDNSYTLDVNQFADLTDNEFESLYTSKTHMDTMSFDIADDTVNHDVYSSTDIPISFDWRDSGHVTPVKNQAACGSCWAFSAVAGVEAHTSIYKQKTVSLSEQELVDCAWLWACFGCGGGEVNRAFGYIKKNGLRSESKYPYVAHNQFCKNFGQTITNKTFISDWKNVQPMNETRMVDVLFHVGPLNVAVAASSRDFKFYKSGILDKCGIELDHAVLVVGYGVENGKEYFIIKNSWGETFGENGYIRISRNRHMGGTCGVATMPSYPIV
jgi:C1A family cysteine protease